MSRYDEVLSPFVALMEKELHANSHKGDREGWLKMTEEQALGEIEYHVSKLSSAMASMNPDGIREYAADVANLCMMLLDIGGQLNAAPPPPQPIYDEAKERELFIAFASDKTWFAPGFKDRDDTKMQFAEEFTDAIWIGWLACAQSRDGFFDEVTAVANSVVNVFQTGQGSYQVIDRRQFDRVTAERDAALGRVSELESSFDELTAAVGFSEARLDQTGDSPIDCVNQLQQRLTAADERQAVMEKALMRIARPHDCGCLPCHGDCTSKLALEIAVEEMRETACAALKPAECCTISAGNRALLEAGDYTPEELFGVGGKPSCPKCAK